MADEIEVNGGPPAVDQSGNLTIWAMKAPTSGSLDLDAVKVTDLAAAACKRITYSFTPDGYSLTNPQEKNDDDRLTSPQKRQALGKTSPELADLKYVDTVDPKSAAVILKDPGSYIFFERRNVPQTKAATVGDIVRAMRLSLGVQAPGPTNGSGKFTLQQAAVVEYLSAPHALAA